MEDQRRQSNEDHAGVLSRGKETTAFDNKNGLLDQKGRPNNRHSQTQSEPTGNHLGQKDEQQTQVPPWGEIRWGICGIKGSLVHSSSDELSCPKRKQKGRRLEGHLTQEETIQEHRKVQQSQKTLQTSEVWQHSYKNEETSGLSNGKQTNGSDTEKNTTWSQADRCCQKAQQGCNSFQTNKDWQCSCWSKKTGWQPNGSNPRTQPRPFAGVCFSLVEVNIGQGLLLCCCGILAFFDTIKTLFKLKSWHSRTLTGDLAACNEATSSESDFNLSVITSANGPLTQGNLGQPDAVDAVWQCSLAGFHNTTEVVLSSLLCLLGKMTQA